MVEDKVGQKPYLGIEINYDKEKICKVDRFHIGNTNKFNSKTNYAYYKSTATNSCFTNAEMPKSSSGARVLGKF